MRYSKGLRREHKNTQRKAVLNDLWVGLRSDLGLTLKVQGSPFHFAASSPSRVG